MTRGELIIRWLVIAIAVLTPFICVFVYESGGLWRLEDSRVGISYSSYFLTPLQPLFILSNAITAFYFFDAEKWKAPAVLLILLTAFSLEYYHTIHNLLAVAFFLSCLEPLWNTNHYRWVIVPYIAAAVVWWHDMMIAEVIAILSLATHHGLVLHKMSKLNKLKQINHEQNERES